MIQSNNFPLSKEIINNSMKDELKKYLSNLNKSSPISAINDSPISSALSTASFSQY